MLNQQQIPVIAGLTLQTKDGPYFNADDATEAPAAIRRLRKVDPAERPALDRCRTGHRAELRRSLHRSRLIPGASSQRSSATASTANAWSAHSEAYSALIGQIQAQGYPVETYTLPYGPIERDLHTTLLDRLLGTVDVQSNENDLMIYTSYARPVGSAIILDLGPSAQGIVVGVTDGPPPAGSGFGPLDWNEFSSDLLVASHFAHHIGVYNLEGCVRQGFLPRLETMDWGASVVIPAASVLRADRHVMAFGMALWIAAHLVYLAAGAVLLMILLVWRWRVRRRRLKPAV